MMTNVFNMDMMPGPVGKWQMLWIKIVGKRRVTLRDGYKIVSYSYKGCAYVTFMKGVDDE